MFSKKNYNTTIYGWLKSHDFYSSHNQVLTSLKTHQVPRKTCQNPIKNLPKRHDTHVFLASQNIKIQKKKHIIPRPKNHQKPPEKNHPPHPPPVPRRSASVNPENSAWLSWLRRNSATSAALGTDCRGDGSSGWWRAGGGLPEGEEDLPWISWLNVYGYWWLMMVNDGFLLTDFRIFHHRHNLMIYCSILLGISLLFAH